MSIMIKYTYISYRFNISFIISLCRCDWFRQTLAYVWLVVLLMLVYAWILPLSLLARPHILSIDLLVLSALINIVLLRLLLDARLLILLLQHGSRAPLDRLGPVLDEGDVVGLVAGAAVVVVVIMVGLLGAEGVVDHLVDVPGPAVELVYVVLVKGLVVLNDWIQLVTLKLIRTRRGVCLRWLIH